MASKEIMRSDISFFHLIHYKLHYMYTIYQSIKKKCFVIRI